MNNRRKRACVAVVIGILLSVVLFLLSYATRNEFLAAPQWAGFFITMLLRGIHSASKTDYALIGIPINAAIYALIIFGLTGLRGVADFATERKKPGLKPALKK